FAAEFPDRFFNMGIQEAHMVGTAAGLALSGKVPFVSSFSSFLLCKAYDQIRMAVAYSEAPVKLVGSHGGNSLGQDGESQMGIQEAHIVGTSAGLALTGKVPFVSIFSSFLLCKAYDQIRMAVAYSEAPVKLVGSHGGFSLGQDGVSQMSIDDIALAMTFPGFAVVCPADEVATRLATRAIAEWPGPAFMRVGRPKAPIVYE